MTPQTLFTSWQPYSSWEDPRTERDRCVLLDGNRNYPRHAYL